MIIAIILIYIAAGIAAVYFSCAKPNRARYRRIGYGLLILSGCGLVGTGVTTAVHLVKNGTQNDGETLFPMFFITCAAAAAACIVVTLGTIYTGRRLIHPLAVLVPFLWAALLLLWTWMCASWTEEAGEILSLGISLCAVLLVCPAAAFLRAAAALKREGVLEQRLEELAQKKKRRDVRKSRRQQIKRLRAPRKRRKAKSSNS